MAEAAGIRTKTPLEGGQKGSTQRKEIPICNGFRYHYITTLVNAGLKTEHRFLLEGHNLKYNDMFYVHVSTSAVQEKTKPIAKVECPKCGEKLEPFYIRTHHCEGTD